jgi:hypothetical protein
VSWRKYLLAAAQLRRDADLTLPAMVDRLIRSGVRAPRHFGPAELADVFPPPAWRVLAHGPTVLYGVPVEPGAPSSGSRRCSRAEPIGTRLIRFVVSVEHRPRSCLHKAAVHWGDWEASWRLWRIGRRSPVGADCW